MSKFIEFQNWLSKDSGFKHKHENWPIHPISVKNHNEYFQNKITSSSKNIKDTDVVSKIQDSISKNTELTNVLSVLSSRGTPYLVGGCVRDIILGEEAKDFDIEVYGIRIDDLGSLLSAKLGAKAEQVGKAFGVFKVGNFDISLPRTEVKTGDKHISFEIKPDASLDVETAAKRRDFTFNSLMFSYKDNKFVDFFGGLKDLQNRIIRHIDDKTFVEDALRVYRAAQFAARFSKQFNGCNGERRN